MYLILFVLSDISQFDDVIDAWEAAGARGITILPSTGLARMREAVLREDIPLFPSIEDILNTHEESYNRTIFTITDDDSLIHRILDATQSVIGDLSNPNTGILISIPLAHVFGLGPKREC